MDEKKQEQVTEDATQETVEPKKKKKEKKVKKPPSKLRQLVNRVVALVVTVILVLGAVYLVANRDKLNVDALRRAISYRTSSGEEATQFSYSAAPSGAFAQLDGGILVCSDTGFQLVARNGETVIDETVAMEQPVVSTAGDYAVVYDAGGTALYLLHKQEVVRTYTPAKGQDLLSARVSENGYLTVVEEASGYKAAVTVYDTDGEPVITENISSAFISDAILSPDGKTLAVVSIGEDTAGFNTAIVFYNISDGNERTRFVLGNDVVLDLDWEKTTLWVAGEYGTYCIEKDAMTVENVDASRNLQSFSLEGDGFAAMFYTNYQGGSAGSITLLDGEGTEHSLGINEEVLDVSAAGDYVAVLTGNELTIYKSDLTLYAATSNSWGARRVLMREDGSALLVTNESASLYLPE